MKLQWDDFSADFGNFSQWISETEQQLEDARASAAPLQEQMQTVKVQIHTHVTAQRPCGGVSGLRLGGRESKSWPSKTKD